MDKPSVGRAIDRYCTMTSGSVYALPLGQASIHSSDIKTRCDPKQNFTRGQQVAFINSVTISRFSVTARATCNLLQTELNNWLQFYYATTVQRRILISQCYLFPCILCYIFKLYFCLLYVAYLLRLFSFLSLFVCCGMTLGAAVCHASY